MKAFPLSKGVWLIRFDRGEEAIASLLAFARARKMRGAELTGLGSLESPVLAYYDLKKKRYVERAFRGVYEVAGMIGNVAAAGGTLALHCHCVIGGRSLRAYAGHLVRGAAGGTLEVVLRRTRPLKRARDARTGLDLLY